MRESAGICRNQAGFSLFGKIFLNNCGLSLILQVDSKIHSPDMSKRSKRWNFWLRRRSHLGVLIVGGIVIMMLFFNDDASWENNMKYEAEIRELNRQIKVANDSAQYYRDQRARLLAGQEELERLAREEYHMQKPTEDVYINK